MDLLIAMLDLQKNYFIWNYLKNLKWKACDKSGVSVSFIIETLETINKTYVLLLDQI